NSRQPTANSYHLSADSRQPTADSRQPTANSRQPQPTADSHQPISRQPQPTSDSHQPTANSQQVGCHQPGVPYIGSTALEFKSSELGRMVRMGCGSRLERTVCNGQLTGGERQAVPAGTAWKW